MMSDKCVCVCLCCMRVRGPQRPPHGDLLRLLLHPPPSPPPFMKERGNKDLGHGMSLVHLAYMVAMLWMGTAWLMQEPMVSGECR